MSGRYYYIGHTENIEARLETTTPEKLRQQEKKGPWVVSYFEIYESKLEANSRELYVKSMKSRVLY